jgi:DNA-binding transcriptional regulator YhcF (GntR family)
MIVMEKKLAQMHIGVNTVTDQNLYAHLQRKNIIITNLVTMTTTVVNATNTKKSATKKKPAAKKQETKSPIFAVTLMI